MARELARFDSERGDRPTEALHLREALLHERAARIQDRSAELHRRRAEHLAAASDGPGGVVDRARIAHLPVA